MCNDKRKQKLICVYYTCIFVRYSSYTVFSSCKKLPYIVMSHPYIVMSYPYIVMSYPYIVMSYYFFSFYLFRCPTSYGRAQNTRLHR